MKRFWLWVPFVLFVAIMAVFARGLISPTDRAVASAMVGKPMPQITLAGALDPAQMVGTQYFKDGKPRLLNVFASWCIPCVAEVPVLMQMQAQGVEITGIAIHDTTPDLQKFLSANGNPYSRIGLDANSRAQIAFGSAGVPETFVVDGNGVIRHQHIGVITPNDVPIILAKLKAAQ
jgi:cytochrome c biogenesis protein CcmG, thiol:disulfide interchange protein DsbE